jgi:hypothetical protein
MGSRFINTYGDVDVSSFVLDGNLYWNAGGALPTEEPPVPGSDAHRIVEDPLLETDHGSIVLPEWDASSGRFVSGSATVREEFVRLVDLYGSIPETSPAVDAADPAHMPADDILGRTRDSSPDVGAYEFVDHVPEPVESPPEAMPDVAVDAGVDVPVDMTLEPASDPAEESDGGGDQGSGCGCRLVV